MADIAREGFLLPHRVGTYEIERLLGRGGMASVYEARNVSDGAPVALKVLHPHLSRDSAATARFLREGRVLSQLIHPNIVRVLEVGEHIGIPYLVMSLVEGEDLSDHIRELRPLSLRDIQECMLPVIDAVAAAHVAGVVHRDLKPSNIRLERRTSGRVVPKVLDFGISRLTQDDVLADLTESGEALGTLSYMAPEQLRSSRRADERSDIYAIGVTLYECATGRRPFGGASAYDRMHAILTDEVTPPTFHRRDLPEAFDAVVLRAMRREPAERFGSARELGAALGRLSADVPVATRSAILRSARRGGGQEHRLRAEADEPSIRGAYISPAKAWISRTYGREVYEHALESLPTDQ